MITRLGMAPRALGMTYEAFQEHWRGEHADAASQLPGVRSYVQNHAVLRDCRPLLPYAGFDACSEIQFDSLASLDAAFASDTYRGPVTDDERVFIDRQRFLMFVSESVVVVDGAPTGDAVKLMTFFPRDPRSDSGGALEAVLGGEYRLIVAEAKPLRHEQLFEIRGAHEGRYVPVFNAVDQLWFPSVAEALDFVGGEIGHRAGYALAGVAFGLERIVARPVRVI